MSAEKIINTGEVRIKILLLNKSHVTKKYLTWLNDPKITHFTSLKKDLFTIDSVKKFVLEKSKSKHEFVYGIFLNNNHIGNCKLGPINFKKKYTQISYFIGEKKHWNKGIATFVVKKLCKKAKNKNLKVVYAGSSIKNYSSIKVLNKNNFKITKAITDFTLDRGSKLFRKNLISKS